ncbi:MAG: GNAT family N-acetyltransferase [Hyphomonadaceae bacterium]|nr:GNAT family N-acetyltransferase [Hyphomonadaceae bacterium]
MVFLRRDPADDGERRIEGALVYLRHPDVKDFQEWAELRSRSRAFLTPWEPTWAEDELSKAAFRYRVRRYLQDIDDGRAYPYFMFSRADHRLVGGATLSQVRRGAAQAATLGYWIGAPHQNRGYTTDAVRTIVHYAFEDLNLHRVEAACQPENHASQAVLRKAGFEHEGRARAYLRINGAWRDHLLFGRTRPEDAKPAPSRPGSPGEAPQ